MLKAPAHPFVYSLILAFVLAASHAAASEDDLELAEQRAFQAAVDRVAPSVVCIETVGGLDRVGRMSVGTGPTTGLVVDPGGYIISSAFNFLNRPDSILVRLADGSHKPAQLVATDHSRMLVLLKIEPDGPLPVPEIAPEAEIRVGQWAIAVGRTFDADRPNVSVGIVSALGRVWGKAVQTDAAVSPNNYGGPLIDVRGRVLGVLVPLSPEAATEVAGVEWYDSGIGFAVPAWHVRDVLARLEKGEDLYPGVLGISFAGENLSTIEPVIAARHPNSPAREAGLEAGDRIVEIEGRKVERASQVKAELSRRYAGQSVRLVVTRGNERIDRELPLVARLEPYDRPFLGILPMRETPGAEGGSAGVVVRYVYPEGPAAAAGVGQGDVLVAMGGEPIRAGDELRRRISDREPGDEIELGIRRGQETLQKKVRLGRLPEDPPPATLPPARAGVGPRAEPAPAPGQSGGVQTGSVELKIPEFENEAWAYVPEGYDPAVRQGVVVWLDAPGRFDWDALVARWKPHCDRAGLILLAAKPADPDGWQAREITLVRKLLDEVRSTYAVDPARIVAGGQGAGGTVACVLAFTARDAVRAVAAVDAPLAGRPPENDPVYPLAFHLAWAHESPDAGQIEASVTRLREMEYPVTGRPLGGEPRGLGAEELSELVRWIDMLDRI